MQFTSKLSNMAASFLNDSLFPNLQKNNQFHIYDNKLDLMVAQILLIFICFAILCYHKEILEMNFENSFLLFIISVLMRFKEGKYKKLCQRKSEIKLPKKSKTSLLPFFGLLILSTISW